MKLTFPTSPTEERQWILNLGQEGAGAHHWIWNPASEQNQGTSFVTVNNDFTKIFRAKDLSGSGVLFSQNQCLSKYGVGRLVLETTVLDMSFLPVTFNRSGKFYHEICCTCVVSN